MKIISSYGVELRKQNIPIRQTLEIYRSAVRYLVEVYTSMSAHRILSLYFLYHTIDCLFHAINK